MNTKKLWVSFSAIVSLLLLVMTVSAATTAIATNTFLEVKGISELGNEDISVLAGEVIPVKVVFEALVNASDVSIEAELQGEKEDFETDVFVGDIEVGKRYTKTFNLRVPYELQDEFSDDLTLNIKIENSDFKTEFSEVTLRVQRPAYNTEVMSISTKATVNAGEVFQVDVVIKNIGYNKLDDLYVTVSVPVLELARTVYLGDLVAIETDDDNDQDGDTVRGRTFLEIPYNVIPGIYTLEVEAKNSDVTINDAKQIFIQNEVLEAVVKSGNSLIVVNPTNRLKVYNIVAESPATVSDSVVVVPAGSSRTITVDPNSSESVSVSVLSGDVVLGTVEFNGKEASEGSSTTGVVVLTVVLGIIFLVLLIVLIVLLTRKPDKEDEFGESYY